MSHSVQQEIAEPVSESKVFAMEDGEYILVSSNDKPVPVQGEEQFYRDMYTKMQYPASARNNNIQGTVMFEILINELGQVKNIERLNSLSLDCDIEAEAAIKRGCSKGFQPFIFNGTAVNIKYLIPVKFKLR